MIANTTLGAADLDIFETSNVNANDGGGVVDITSVQAGISGGQLPQPPSMPSGGSISWLAITLLLAIKLFVWKEVAT